MVKMRIFRPYPSFAMPESLLSPLEDHMKTFLLCGIAVASVLMLQSVPAAAQRVHGAGHARVGHGYAGHWRGGNGHGYGGYGVGVGVAALATGALIGGAIASQNQGYYYGDQNYPGYSDPGYVYSNAGPVAYNNGGTVAYCEQTYRSYDPASGSYLGYDGFRHPCP
jgi:BA14K-like protein